MTGGELVAAAGAAKALTSAAKSAADEDEPLKQQLREKAKDSQAMEAAAEAHARRIAVKQEILLKLFMPLALLLGVSKDYFHSTFSNEMAEKVKDIPEEDLVPPKGSVAGPTMQALGYSLDEPDLKEMYLNLLTTAVDGRRAEQAHPSFVEVIRQLSSAEAPTLTFLKHQIHLPIVRIKRTDASTGGYVILANHIMNNVNLETGEPHVDPQLPFYVDNWVRLRLVTVSYTEYLTSAGVYSWADERPELKDARDAHEADGATVGYDQGILSPTNFGRQFASAVM